MKQFRKIIFWLHLCAGVFAGIVVLIMSVTGVALTYEKQMLQWADLRHYRSAPPEAGAPHLPVGLLLEKVRAEKGEFPTTVTVRPSDDDPVALSYGRETTLYANPYSGEILGEGSPGLRNFFRFMTDWHRWLGASGENRNTGRAITGACNLAFLFMVVSGLYLWWPRNWRWPNVKSIIFFRGGMRGKARDFNWHNVIGFWSAVPLFFVVLSATVISYPWASNLVYRVVGEEPPARRGPGGPGGPGERPRPGGRNAASPPRAAGSDASRAGLRAETPPGAERPGASTTAGAEADAGVGNPTAAGKRSVSSNSEAGRGSETTAGSGSAAGEGTTGGSGALGEGPRREARGGNLTGREGPPQRGRGGPGFGSPSDDIQLEGFDALLARARQQVPDWRTISLRLPRSDEEPLSFQIDQGSGGQPQLRSTLTLDRKTAEVVRWETFGDGSPGRRLRSWLRFIHTGEAGGLAGQTVAGLVSGGAVFLVYTGLALSLRRFLAWVARKRWRAREEVLVED